MTVHLDERLTDVEAYGRRKGATTYPGRPDSSAMFTCWDCGELVEPPHKCKQGAERRARQARAIERKRVAIRFCHACAREVVDETGRTIVGHWQTDDGPVCRHCRRDLEPQPVPDGQGVLEGLEP